MNNHTKPLLSILIPVYNTQEYLPKCIDSVLAQSYGNTEIILVDDGSTDESGKICDRYAEKDERVVVIHKENGGLGSARVAGIKASKGEFITFVDSDDWIEPDMYENMMDALQKRPEADIIVGGYVTEKKGKTVPVFEPGKSTAYTSADAMVEMFKSQHFNWSLCDKIYKKSIFDKTDLLDRWKPSYGEDTYANWTLFGNAEVVCYKPVYGYHYVTHDTSMMKNRSFSGKEAYFDIYSYILREAMDSRNYNLVKEVALVAVSTCGALIQEAKADKCEMPEQISHYEKKTKECKESLIEFFIDMLKRFSAGHSRLLMYGAGKIAQRIAPILDDHGIGYDVVTSTGEGYFGDKKIVPLKKVLSGSRDDIGIILAMNKNNCAEVMEQLSVLDSKQILAADLAILGTIE